MFEANTVVGRYRVIDPKAIPFLAVDTDAKGEPIGEPKPVKAMACRLDGDLSGRIKRTYVTTDGKYVLRGSDTPNVYKLVLNLSESETDSFFVVRVIPENVEAFRKFISSKDARKVIKDVGTRGQGGSIAESLYSKGA